MDGGAHRLGLRRRARGAGGAPRQGPRAGVAAGGGGGGDARQGAARRGGGRAGGRAGNGGDRQVRAAHRPRRPRPAAPRLTDWWTNVKYANPLGLSLEVYEERLDDVLAKDPRIDFKELDFYTIHRDLLEQGAYAVRLLTDADDGFRKMGLSRKILLKMYTDGQLNTPGAIHWRKCLQTQMESLEDTIYQLQKSKKNHHPIPTIFLTPPSLLPKEKKK